MNRQKKSENVLVFTRTMGQGGTENVVLQLCEILKPIVNNVVVCSCGGVNESKLEEMGVKHYTIPDITEKSPMAMITIAKQLKRIVKDEQITIIHSHHRMAAFYTELLFGKDIIKIANAHNTFTDKASLTRFAYRNTHVVAVGEKVKENLVEFYGMPEQQVTVIHNAIKPFNDKVIPVKELQEAREAGYTLVGNIGRLSKQKGMTYFIQASAEVVKVCPKTRFFIIGSGELEDELKKEARRLLPEGTVSFLGYRSDIQSIMSQLDFLVLSSLWEGFPLTPIEAFSVGKPVIATAVDGTTEIVEDGVNGLLAKPGDAKGLSDAMIDMIRNKGEQERFGVAAYKCYENKFSVEKMAEKYVKFYEGVRR